MIDRIVNCEPFQRSRLEMLRFSLKFFSEVHLQRIYLVEP